MRFFLTIHQTIAGLSLSLLLGGMAQIVRAQPPNTAALKQQLGHATTDTGRCRLLYELGQHYGTENLDSAFYFLNASLRVARRTGDSVAVARAMCQLGFTCLYYQKDEAQTVIWLNEALTVANQSQDHLHLARCFQLLAVLDMHQRIGDPLALLATARHHANMTSNWRIRADVYGTFASLYIDKKKYELAAWYSQKEMTTCKRHNLDKWFSAGLDYCEMLDAQGKHRQCLSMTRRLAAVTHRLPRTNGVFVYTNDMARLAVYLKNYPEAESILLSGLAVENRRSRPDSLHLFHYYRTLVDVYVRQSAYQKAYYTGNDLADVRLWLQRTRQTRDSRVQMTQLKARLDMEQKERELSEMTVRQHKQLLYLIVAVIIVVLLVSFVFVLQRSRQRVEGQKAELARLHTTKDKLFAILSHDLRSPVGTLTSYLSLIDWGALSQQEFVALIPGLNTQLHNVQTTLDNVLYWAMSQMNGFKPVIGPLNVHELVQEQIDLQQATADAKGIQLSHQIPPGTHLLADKNHLIVIIRNLLQNALKFTPAGGRICFTHTRRDNRHQVTITDTGIGISADRLSTLFQLGQNAPPPGTAGEQGTGLGLVLVHELATINQGAIAVQSEPGKGTSFSLTFG